MADTLKTYNLECPFCGEEFDVELGPAQLTDESDCIECPGCGEECEWEYDSPSDTLELLADEDSEDDLLLTETDDDEG